MSLSPVLDGEPDSPPGPTSRRRMTNVRRSLFFPPSIHLLNQNQQKRCAALDEILGKPADGEVYADQRGRILDIAEKHLTDDHSWTGQTIEARVAFFSELREEFPNIFQGASADDKLVKISYYVASTFSGRRHRQRLAAQGSHKTSRKRKHPYIKLKNTDDPDEEEEEVREIVEKIEEGATGISAIWRPVASRTDIHGFLNLKCSPAIPYLTDSLIAAGAINLEYLGSMAIWPIEEIREFLGNYLRTDEGMSPSAVEIRILARQIAAMM
ncbi:hypothetical protein C8J56DRAFT_1090436 [Mycena floridula]|nr:hypothetical protein C8J56DRAFT_1090436 [Mycena floridula]